MHYFKGARVGLHYYTAIVVHTTGRIFSYISSLGPFFGVPKFKFQYFGGFSEK